MVGHLIVGLSYLLIGPFLKPASQSRLDEGIATGARLIFAVVGAAFLTIGSQP